MHCLWREFARYDPSPGEEFADDCTTGEGNHNHGSIGDGVDCEAERHDAAVNTCAPHLGPACSGTHGNSTGERQHGQRPVATSPAGQRSASNGTPGYFSTGYSPTGDVATHDGAAHDDNESRRWWGWNWVLAVSTTDRGRRRPISLLCLVAHLHTRRRHGWRRMGT